MTQSPSPIVDEVAERREALLAIIRDAVIETAKRPEGRRGPFAFDAAELQALADDLASLVSPPKAGAGEPVAWQVEGGGSITTSRQVADTWVAMFGCKVIPLAPLNHEARGDGVRVRALEWSNGGVPHTKATSVAGVYTINGTSGGRYQLNRDYQPRPSFYPTLESAKAAAQLDYETRIRTALEAALPPLGDGRAERRGIYMASKVAHAGRWRILRDKVGYPIISTWIDEAGEGESQDLSDLWRRCIAEASSAEVLVLNCEPGEILKGGWVELGAALASGVAVFAVGIEQFTVSHDRRIRHFPTMAAAMEALKPMINGVPFRSLSNPGGSE